MIIHVYQNVIIKSKSIYNKKLDLGTMSDHHLNQLIRKNLKQK